MKQNNVLKFLTYFVPGLTLLLGAVAEVVNYKNMQEMVKEEIAEQLAEESEEEEA